MFLGLGKGTGLVNFLALTACCDGLSIISYPSSSVVGVKPVWLGVSCCWGPDTAVTASLFTLNSVFQCRMPTAMKTLVDNMLVPTSMSSTTVTPEFTSPLNISTTLVTMLVVLHMMLRVIPIKKKQELIFMMHPVKMRVVRELLDCSYIVTHLFSNLM